MNSMLLYNSENLRYYPVDPEPLGTFEVVSGQLTISDPCYEPGTWCAGTLSNVKMGTWKGFVVTGETDWGYRCWELVAVYGDQKVNDMNFAEKTDIKVGVDSGQAGIYETTKFHGGEDDYGDENGWYRNICEITQNSALGGIIDGGVVCSSGFGDGSYEFYISRNEDGQIVGVKIEFITVDDFVENSLDDDEDDEEDEELN